MGRPEPVVIGAVLESILGSMGVDKRNIQLNILRFWGQTAGKDIAAHTKPAELKNGILTVHVDSSVWFNELNRFYKKGIVTKMNKLLGEQKIKDIRFKIGEI